MLFQLIVTVTCVVWLDASGGEGWIDPAEYEARAPIVSCGLLLDDEGDYIVLAMDRSLTPDGGHDDEAIVNQVGSIPSGMVIRRVDVEVEVPPRPPE